MLERLGRDESVHAVVLPRTAEQRAAIRALGLPSLHVPEHAVDAQSLVALADLVVSAGGTMNREAVALGTPVYTTFAGRLGGVDEGLIREGRLVRSPTPTALELSKREPGRRGRIRRDPRLLLDLLLPSAPSRLRGAPRWRTHHRSPGGFTTAYDLAATCGRHFRAGRGPADRSAASPDSGRLVTPARPFDPAAGYNRYALSPWATR